MSRLTTQDEFSRMIEQIANYSPNDWDNSISINQLISELLQCNEVYNSLSKNEMRLIWYLRHSSIGTTVKFLASAKLQYEAYMALPNHRAK